MSETIVVIGDGAMSGLCAKLLSENGHRVRLFTLFADTADELRRTRRSQWFFDGQTLSEAVEVTADPAEALADADLAIQSVPSQYVRLWWQQLADHCQPKLPICSVAKGIENDTLLRPTEVVREVLDGSPDSSRPMAVLSGPCIAPEVDRELPATVTVASIDEDMARRVQQSFSRPYFRAYTNTDVAGTEIAGATKNVIAIAAGILDGLSAGCNAKAALLTRGLVEITRLGVAMGAQAETFAGLAGFGDLVTTCISPLGRNRTFGQAIGEGRSAEEVLATMHSVVEGVATTKSVMQLADRTGVEMPITAGVHDVLFGGRTPAEAIAELMSRPLKAES